MHTPNRKRSLYVTDQFGVKSLRDSRHMYVSSGIHTYTRHIYIVHVTKHACA